MSNLATERIASVTQRLRNLAGSGPYPASSCPNHTCDEPDELQPGRELQRIGNKLVFAGMLWVRGREMESLAEAKNAASALAVFIREREG